MKRKKVVLVAVSIALLAIIGTACIQTGLFTALRAKYKSTEQFLTLAEDSRVHYENNARTDALALQKILQASQKNVEFVLKARFKKPITVYVCASQDSFNEYVFLSKNVRGAVYWGRLFLSPGAFSRDEDALVELTTHELTHYLFYTHLGEKAHLENIPLWFREGVAVFVANGGAEYTKDNDVASQMSGEEKTAYLSGNMDFWFASNDPRDALSKSGTANWLAYRVGAMFVHYLHDFKPEYFEKLMQLLLSGAEFHQAVKASYGENIDVLLNGFSHSLTTTHASKQ